MKGSRNTSRILTEDYDRQHQVILKSDTNRQVVLYNPNDASVSIKKFDNNLPITLQTNHQTAFNCPMCNRPFNISTQPNYTSARMHSSFMDANYFRLLSKSLNRHNTVHLQLEGPLDQEQDDELCYINQECLNQGYYKRFFVERERLGKGFRGSVFSCQHMLDNIPLGEYAIKKVPIGDRRNWLIRMLKEVHILERLDHPNIIHYKHAWIENHQLTIFGPEIPVLFILMELANGGDLEHYILRGRPKKEQKPLVRVKRKSKKDFRPILSSSEIISFISNVVQGLRHLHTHHILHRDLKPSNLLLRYIDLEDATEIPTLSISDFGECETLYSKISERKAERTGGTGTLEFMAPELLQVDSHGRFTGEHSCSSDIWSLGMVIYFIIFQHTFFPAIDDDDVLRQRITGYNNKISFPPSPDFLDPETFSFLTNIIRKCISRNPDDRPTIHDVAGQLELFLRTRNSYTATNTRSVGMISDISNSEISWKLSKQQIYLSIAVLFELSLYLHVYEERGCNAYGLVLFMVLNILSYQSPVHVMVLQLIFVLYYELSSRI